MFASGPAAAELGVVDPGVSVSENGPPPLPLVVGVFDEAPASPGVSLVHATSEPVSATSTNATKTERLTRKSPILS